MLNKLRRWWNKDRGEIADEEARMTQGERDVAEEDYEARKDDIATRLEAGSGAGAGGIDFERDSEKP